MLFFSIILLFTSELNAQDRMVSGKVTDGSDGTGIPGSSIVVKGSNRGLVTDANGNFKIAAAAGSTLVISSVGYLTQEVAIGSRSEINVSLATDL